VWEYTKASLSARLHIADTDFDTSRTFPANTYSIGIFVAIPDDSDAPW